MEKFRVQLWPDGKWDGKPYEDVYASNAKEAAEKLYGRALSDRGANSKIRAHVKQIIGGKTISPIFYEP